MPKSKHPEADSLCGLAARHHIEVKDSTRRMFNSIHFEDPKFEEPVSIFSRPSVLPTYMCAILTRMNETLTTRYGKTSVVVRQLPSVTDALKKNIQQLFELQNTLQTMGILAQRLQAIDNLTHAERVVCQNNQTFLSTFGQRASTLTQRIADEFSGLAQGYANLTEQHRKSLNAESKEQLKNVAELLTMAAKMVQQPAPAIVSEQATGLVRIAPRGPHARALG